MIDEIDVLHRQRHRIVLQSDRIYRVPQHLVILVGDLLQFLLEFVNFLSALADDETGAGGAHGDGNELGSALDDDAAYRSLSEAFIEVFADFAILEDIVAVVVATEPVGVPTADDTESVSNRSYFLSHVLLYL